MLVFLCVCVVFFLFLFFAFSVHSFVFFHISDLTSGTFEVHTSAVSLSKAYGW